MGEAPGRWFGRGVEALGLAEGQAIFTDALTWDYVDLDGDPKADAPRPPSIMVWRSVRAGGKTKTRKSRRTLKLPQRCVAALSFHRDLQVVALLQRVARPRPLARQRRKYEEPSRAGT